MDEWPSRLMQQGYRHPAQICDGQDEMESFREICPGHNRH